MQPLTKEQLEQAANIFAADMSLNGAIRAWACGVHGQQKISYVFEDGKVKAKCQLCDSNNQWEAKKIEDKFDAKHELLHNMFLQLQKETKEMLDDK